MVFFDNCIFKSVGLKPEYHFTFSFSYFFFFYVHLFYVSFCHRLIFSKWASYRIFPESGSPTFFYFLGASFCLKFFCFCRLIFVERVSYGGGGCEGAGCSGDNSFKRLQEIFPVNDSIPFQRLRGNTMLERNLPFCAFSPI